MSEKLLTSLDKEEMIMYMLLNDKEYSDFVLPHLEEEYFPEHYQRLVFKCLDKFTDKYSKLPSEQELKVLFTDLECSEQAFEAGLQLIETLEHHKEILREESISSKWAIDMTEEWCKRRAFTIQIEKSIEIIESGKDPSTSGAMEGMQTALSVNFDRDIGHSFFDDAEKRYESYQDVEERIPFILSSFNKISGGGMEKGTLSCFLSNRTGGFKTGTMCHLAADNIRLGLNVLYITMELSEVKVARRIDANLLNMKINDLAEYPKKTYIEQLGHIHDKYAGRLITKQFPTSVAHAGHFRFLLKELRRKKGFVPDVVYFDYLNIAASQHLPATARASPYLWVKCIAEEMRGLCVEFNFAGFTATQSNRGGTGASDLELTDTSESIGLPNILDLYMAVIRTEEMDEQNIIKYKQLKNRDNDEGTLRSFEMGVDMSKMKIWDLEDHYPSGSTKNPMTSSSSKAKISGFGGFKFD